MDWLKKLCRPAAVRVRRALDRSDGFDRWDGSDAAAARFGRCCDHALRSPMNSAAPLSNGGGRKTEGGGRMKGKAERG